MTTISNLDVFSELESNVRSYCRAWPAVFERASGSRLWDENGKQYIDFFAGAGALNYGHNPPEMKRALIEYIDSDGILHSLDMATAAKREFLKRFESVILRPRGLRYKVQFPGPTGTNAVEAALKLARKVSGRETVIAFNNGFHGMTLGALAVTSNPGKRQGAGVPLTNAVSVPFDGELGPDVDTIAALEAQLFSGGELEGSAAVIVETVQGEGGINVASIEWLQRLAELCSRHGLLLIVDDIQAGCGRTGPFFSFEAAGIEPDIVLLSKSISGIGLPLALVLLRPELDAWAPGEHNGTFRGNNAAFVAGTAALERWRDNALTHEVERKADRVREELSAIAAQYEQLRASVRSCGLLQGLHTPLPGVAAAITAAAFDRGLLMETSGADDDVAKVMPALTIPDDDLERGLEILNESVPAALSTAG